MDTGFDEKRSESFRRSRLRSVILTLWILVTLFPALYFSEHYLLLVWHYGFSQVHKYSLHFVSMPSSKNFEDYIVSNGDHLPHTEGFMAFPFAIAVWAILIAVGYFLIKRTFRGKENTIVSCNPQFQRRSAKTKKPSPSTPPPRTSSGGR
jgi:hypothetical protein